MSEPNTQGGNAQGQESTAAASANAETQQQPVAASTAPAAREQRPPREDRRPRGDDRGYDRRRERDYDDDYPRGDHRYGDERHDRHDSRASAGNSTHVSVSPTPAAPAVPPQTSFLKSPLGIASVIGSAIALLILGGFLGPKLTGKAAAAAPNPAPAQAQPQPADNSSALKPQISGASDSSAALASFSDALEAFNKRLDNMQTPAVSVSVPKDEASTSETSATAIPLERGQTKKYEFKEIPTEGDGVIRIGVDEFEDSLTEVHDNEFVTIKTEEDFHKMYKGLSQLENHPKWGQFYYVLMKSKTDPDGDFYHGDTPPMDPPVGWRWQVDNSGRWMAVKNNP